MVKDILVLHQLFTTSQFSNEIDTLNSGDENDYVYIRRFIYGMQTAIESKYGAAQLAKIDNVTVCGKTGTAQNPHGEDHSIFIGFAF